MSSYRLLQYTLKPNRNIQFALTTVKGIGNHHARAICRRFGIHPLMKVKDVGAELLPDISRVIERDYLIENKLMEKQAADVKRLVDIGCRRGIRHVQCLPVRGQRTRCNNGTQKKLGQQRKTMYNLGMGPREAWTQQQKEQEQRRILKREIARKKAGR